MSSSQSNHDSSLTALLFQALLSQHNTSTPQLTSSNEPNDAVTTLLSTINNSQKATFTIGGKTFSLNLVSEDQHPQNYPQVPEINLFGFSKEEQSSESNDRLSTDHPKPQTISHKNQLFPQSIANTANQTPFSSQNNKTVTIFDSERKESYFSEKPESLIQTGLKVPSEMSGSSFPPEKDSMNYQKSNANSSLVASLIDQSYLEPIDLTMLPSLGFKSNKENMSLKLPILNTKSNMSPMSNIKSLPPQIEGGKKDELASSDEEKEKIDVKKELTELNDEIEGLTVPENISNKFKKLVTYLEKENQRLERRRKRIEDQNKAQLLREIITPKLSISLEPAPPSQEAQLHFAFMFSAPLVLSYEDFQNNKKLSPIYVEVDYRTELETVKKTLSKSVDPIKFRSFVANQTGLSECFNMKPRALHFCGHGVKNNNENLRSVKSGKREGDFLIMEDEEGQADFKSCSHLQYLLQTNQMNDKLEFVFVASCHSSLVGEVFRKAGAKHVICVGREEKILDDACLKFTEHFYQSYFTGRNSVCKAFSDAKEYLKQMSHLPSGEENKFILLKQEGIHRCEPMFGLQDYNPKEKAAAMDAILKDLTPVPLFHKIPAKIESFLGRHIEQHEVIKRIKTHRFVTIKGISGIGKSSLCREVANYLYERNTFQDGIIYVDATGCDSVERIISVINSKLGYITKSNEGKPVGGIMVQVANYLSDRVKDALIILDNVDEVYHNERAKFRRLIELILVTCFKIKILITSRSAIGGSFQEASEKVFNLSYLDEINARELFFSKAPRPIDVEEMKEFLQYDPALNSQEILLPSENRLRKGSSSSGHYLEAELCLQKTGLDELTLFSKHHLMKMLGGHPQAISLAAALLVDRKLKDLYDKMISDPIMNVLRAEGLSENEANALNSMEVSLDITLKHLEETSKEAINFFGLLGLLPGGVRESDLKNLWGTSWMDCTGLLLKYSLIIRHTNSDSNDVTRYNLYPFMVKYAEERIQEEEKFTISSKIVNYLKDKAETIYNKIGSTFVDSHIFFDIFLNEETNFKVCLKRELEIARNRPESPKKYSEKWDQDLETDMFGSTTEASLKLKAKFEAGKEEIRKSMHKPLTKPQEQEKQSVPGEDVIVTEKFAHELGPSKLRSSLHIQRRSTIGDKILERYNSFKTPAEKGRFTISSTMNLKGDMMKSDYDFFIPLDSSLVLAHTSNENIPHYPQMITSHEELDTIAGFGGENVKNNEENGKQQEKIQEEEEIEKEKEEEVDREKKEMNFGDWGIDLATSVQIKQSDIQGPIDEATPSPDKKQSFKAFNLHDLKYSTSMNIYSDMLKSPTKEEGDYFSNNNIPQIAENNLESLQFLDVLVKGPMSLLPKDFLKEAEDELSTNDVYEEIMKELSSKDSMKEVKLFQQSLIEDENTGPSQAEPFDVLLTKSLSLLKTSILEDLDIEDCFEEIKAELGNPNVVKSLQKSLFDLDFAAATTSMKEVHANSTLSLESSEGDIYTTSIDEISVPVAAQSKSYSSRKSIGGSRPSYKYQKRNSQEVLTSQQMSKKALSPKKKRHSNKNTANKGSTPKETPYPMSQEVLEKARQRSTIHSKQANDPIMEEDENEFGIKKPLTLSTSFGFGRNLRGNSGEKDDSGKGSMYPASYFAVLYCSILFLLLRFDECGKVIVQGLKLVTQIESRDKVGEANLHKLNGCLNWIKTNYEDSLKDFIRAYDLFEEGACILGQAICEAAIGYLSFLLFEDASTTNLAVKRLEQSLALYQQLGHIFGIYYLHRWLSIIMNKVPGMKGKSKEHAKEARKILSLPKARKEVSGHPHKGGFFVPREMGDHFSIFLEIANICDYKALKKREERSPFAGITLNSLGSQSRFKTNPSRFSSLWTETVLTNHPDHLTLKDVGKLETLKEEDEFTGLISRSPSNIEQEKTPRKGSDIKKNVHPSTLMPSLKKKNSNRHNIEATNPGGESVVSAKELKVPGAGTGSGTGK